MISITTKPTAPTGTTIIAMFLSCVMGLVSAAEVNLRPLQQQQQQQHRRLDDTLIGSEDDVSGLDGGKLAGVIIGAVAGCVVCTGLLIYIKKGSDKLSANAGAKYPDKGSNNNADMDDRDMDSHEMTHGTTPHDDAMRVAE